MNTISEHIPNPKEIEKELGEFLAKKFGGKVKMIATHEVSPEEAEFLTQPKPSKPTPEFRFDLKPEELIAYLDQYIVKQDHAKAVLATKICTHFNRIQQARENEDMDRDLVGGIKNNVLMIGPTGVGKTYMVKLIAKKIGVPFVKGDATKFSETGYVGGDVEDLVRDLVQEAGDDIELAQYGIIYIDEIDKIAGSRTIIGADVSRTGVQRALLKPMEETEVDLKVPHDPISMLQEIERFRKTGVREKRVVNTRNILFIMSGAFQDLAEIIQKRLNCQGVGFHATLKNSLTVDDILAQVRTEDLVCYGFESEFVGRLPVRAVFEHLSEEDLFGILKNPNNPIVLGKKLDFAAYGIRIVFEEEALRMMARQAFLENTGARGLVSAAEKALLPFERKLPSLGISRFPVTTAALNDPEHAIHCLSDPEAIEALNQTFYRLKTLERSAVQAYLEENRGLFSERYGLALTPSKIALVASAYCNAILDVGKVIQRLKKHYDAVKRIELSFFKEHDIHIVLDDDCLDYIVTEIVEKRSTLDEFRKDIDRDLAMGLRLVREKTGKNRFFLNRQALINPEAYIAELIRAEMKPKPASLPPPVAESAV
uniref:AAA family ATPase n=1 Tax=Desulfatirhabdium butyrativorans TaxID=340467 RepID=A0A7C4RSR5_9BACT